MLLFDDGMRKLWVRYVQKRGQSYYYRRRYPDDLLGHFDGVKFKVKSLNTRLASEAAKRATALAQQDDIEWEALRIPAFQEEFLATADISRIAAGRLTQIGWPSGHPDVDPLHEYLSEKHDETIMEARNETGEHPGWDFLTPFDKEMIRLSHGGATVKRLSDALEYYLKEHAKGSDKKFNADNRRSVGHVIRLVGDWPLGKYLTVHAEQVRDALLGSVKTRTVRRHLNDIAAVFAKGIRGFDLQIARHPFESIGIVGEGSDAKKKVTFTPLELQTVSEVVHRKDDALRHIAGLLVNTGARAAEIVGLQTADLVLDADVPYIHIRPNQLRGVKTIGSTRCVPLAGVSLWSARRALALHSPKSSEWLFPHYVGTNRSGKLVVKSGSAGTAVNAWLKATLNVDKTSHCFRHTLRDRLRAVGATEAVQDDVGGWGARSVGQRYGDGYQMKLLHEYLDKAAI